MNSIFKKQKGFTLIEVIVSIVIAGLAGMVIFMYLGNVLTRSHEPIGQVRDLAEAVEVMEEVVSLYEQQYLMTDRLEADWSNFEASLTASGVINTDVTDNFPLMNKVLEITITRNNQTIAALFVK